MAGIWNNSENRTAIEREMDRLPHHIDAPEPFCILCEQTHDCSCRNCVEAHGNIECPSLKCFDATGEFPNMKGYALPGEWDWFTVYEQREKYDIAANVFLLTSVNGIVVWGTLPNH